MKLLKAVQGRLGGGGGGALGGALAELGGGNGLVCVAPKVTPMLAIAGSLETKVPLAVCSLPLKTNVNVCAVTKRLTACEVCSLPKTELVELHFE